jgi:hypothetical protein
MLGSPTSRDARMTVRQRIDFSILLLLFGTFVGGLESYIFCFGCGLCLPTVLQSQYVCGLVGSIYSKHLVSLHHGRSLYVFPSNLQVIPLIRAGLWVHASS